jgi:hypothetical protein
MKQTALEWLLKQWPILESQIPIAIIEEALEKEKQQAHKYATFAIECDRKRMKILNFEDYIKL